MGQLLLLLVVVAIGAVGWFIGKLMDRRAAAVTGVICWCLALATCRYAETLHEWEPLLPLAGSFLSALLGMGLIAAAMTGREPQHAPLSEEDAKAAERIAARMERLRALEQSVPDYAPTQSDQTHSPKEPDPPTPPT
jgi:hypothetical protein